MLPWVLACHGVCWVGFCWFGCCGWMGYGLAVGCMVVGFGVWVGIVLLVICVLDVCRYLIGGLACWF